MSSNSVHPAQATPRPSHKEKLQTSDDEKVKELEILQSHKELFVKRSIDDRDKGNPNAPNCYDVLNTFGQPVFKVVQTMELQNSMVEGQKVKSAFRLSVFDMRTGNEILKLMAKSGAESVVVYARQKYLQYYGIGKILRIRRGNVLRGPDYNIRGNNGKLAMKINGGYCFLYKKAAFNICSPDNQENIGKIRKDSENCDNDTNGNNGGYLEAQNALYKITFSSDMNITLKALALATTLILDFDYFECGERETKCDCILLSTALATFTLLIAVVVLILSVNITQRLNSLGSNVTKTDTESSRLELHELVELIDPNVITTTEVIK